MLSVKRIDLQARGTDVHLGPDGGPHLPPAIKPGSMTASDHQRTCNVANLGIGCVQRTDDADATSRRWRAA